MKFVKVIANGCDVEVPIHEVPSLVKELSDLYRIHCADQVHATPTPSPTPTPDGYMSYDECELLLSGLYSGNKLPYHAGRLWGAMCRLTKYNNLHFDTKCTMCSGSMELESREEHSKCPHAIGATGYRMMLISKNSIPSNLAQMTTGRYHQVGESIRSDYRFIASALSM